ncbi:ExbD/TolR family protein, partial [Pontiella sp.]|uniref:ExbD/TolR family protein n=1 Tax=Pontiella sp. TaxID=2837462 RepID=UPI003567E97D
MKTPAGIPRVSLRDHKKSKGSSPWKRILYVPTLEMEVMMILPGVRVATMKYGSSTASLIDVVFLLLIYFMITASLIR